MGANTSASFSDTTSNAVFQSTTNVLNSTTASTTVNNSINQNTLIDIHGNVICGNLVVTQDATIDAQVVSNLNSQQQNQLTNTIIQTLASTFQQQVTQGNTGLNLAQFNTNLNAVVNNQSVKTAINQSITNAIQQTVSVNSQANQQVTIHIVGNWTGKNCVINQTALIKLMAQNITDNVMNTIATNSAVQSLTATYKQQLTQTNTGLQLPNLTIVLIVLGIVGALAIAGGVTAKVLIDKKKAKGRGISAPPEEPLLG